MEKMMMPAYYNVLSTEEMTYTEGGANATMSEALLADSPVRLVQGSDRCPQLPP